MDGWARTGRRSVDREVAKVAAFIVGAGLVVGGAVGVIVDTLLHRHRQK